MKELSNTNVLNVVVSGGVEGEQEAVCRALLELRYGGGKAARTDNCCSISLLARRGRAKGPYYTTICVEARGSLGRRGAQGNIV